VLGVQLDFVSQNAALGVFIAFLVSGEHGRAAELAADVVVIAVTIGVLAVYAR